MLVGTSPALDDGVMVGFSAIRSSPLVAAVSDNDEGLPSGGAGTPGGKRLEVLVVGMPVSAIAFPLRMQRGDKIKKRGEESGGAV